MIKQYKVDGVNSLVEKLKEKQNIVLTNFTGVKVKDLSVLRRTLSDKGVEYKVVKNSLFSRALKEAGYVDINEFLKGPIGVAFTSSDLSEVAQVLKEFKREQDKFNYSVGIMDNVVYSEDDVKRIANLPAKEVLLAQIMSLINGPATSTVLLMNQIISSLARGIKAVAEKNG